MKLEGKPRVRIVSLEQARRLYEAHLELSAPSRGELPLLAFARRIEAILGVKVAILVCRDRVWMVAAESRSDPSLPLVEHSILRRAAELPPEVSVESWIGSGTEWTLIGCPARPAPSMTVAIQGDWTLSSPTLLLLGENISLALKARAADARERLRLTTHRLSRTLSSLSRRQDVSRTIIRYVARALDARIAALAVPDARNGRLSIVATEGYPLALVEHLRIDPGVGVLGSVFRSGRVLHVKDVHRFTQLNRRPRYRTHSFVAVPIRAGREVLGVISVTDRRGDEPFTHEDVSTLRALAGPVALALGRERALAEAETYAQAAALDAVTGAFNRRYFHVRLEEELQRSRRHQIPLAVLMIDVDQFKAINDAFGHPAGDSVIRDIAEILRRSVRVFDVCARFGGDEFAIIMPGSAAVSATRIAERIRQRIASYLPAVRSLQSLRVTASIGLTISTPDATVHDLIAHADQALYLAKGDGRNRVRLHEDDAVRILNSHGEP